MLVLTRGLNEAVMIGDQIEVTVVDIKGGKVRLGIAAPAAVAVHRKEVYLAIRQANLDAAQGAAPTDLDALKKLMGDRFKKKGDGK